MKACLYLNSARIPPLLSEAKVGDESPLLYCLSDVSTCVMMDTDLSDRHDFSIDFQIRAKILNTFGNVFPAFVDNCISRLDWIVLSSDRHSAFGYFLLSVSVQILCIQFSVSLRSSREQILSGFLLPVSAVDVFCIVEYRKYTVISAFLCVQPVF